MNSQQPLFFEHLDLAANSFNLSQIDAAALQLEKALQSVTERPNPEASPHPYSTGAWSELRKSVDALASKQFGVSSVCLNKALDQMEAVNLDHAVAIEKARRIATAVRDENFTEVATQLRALSGVLDGLGRMATADLLE